MVCRRCLWAVEEVFRQQGIALRSLSLGQAEPVEELSPEQLEKLREALGALGFELLNDRLSISEIAYRMGYSSAAYLSSQFKRITGMSPRAFRELRASPRRPLDEV